MHSKRMFHLHCPGCGQHVLSYRRQPAAARIAARIFSVAAVALALAVIIVTAPGLASLVAW
jgi:hypothetical protein